MSEQMTGPKNPEKNDEDRNLQKSKASVTDDAKDIFSQLIIPTFLQLFLCRN